MIQLDLFLDVDAQSTEEQIDLCDCPIYFGTGGKRREDLNAMSNFLCSVPKNKYTIYRVGGTHLLPMYNDREDFPYIFHNSTNRIIHPNFSRAVYPCYTISNEVISKRVYAHRIFAMAFIPNELTSDNYNVDHLNEDKLDYSINNLRWVSVSDNMKNIRGKAQNSTKNYKVYGSSFI